jgi:hypothetical protein
MKLQNLIRIPILVVFIGLLPRVQGVVPAPDGGYPGGNTAEGQAALLSLTTGGYNTAVGFFSLSSNTAGAFNTAIGAGTLLANTGGNNTATGAGALLSNSSGSNNTANGMFALLSNTTGNNNTATGQGALQSNTTGNENTAHGFGALFANTDGIFNTAIGSNALLSNASGTRNTAIGAYALYNSNAGLPAFGINTAVGFHALYNNTTGSENIALGAGAGENSTGDGNIYIGNAGEASESATIRIGNTGHLETFIAGIRDVTTINNDAIPVLIDSAGQLGTASSSRRYKADIKPIDKASESILALKPVSFRYKIHKDTTPQFGLIAEDVAQVNPDLVVRDEKGEIYTVRYDAVNAMLLNEFLKEHRKVQELEANAARQQTQIKALTAGLQKVSAQLELTKSAPQTVLNN